MGKGPGWGLLSPRSWRPCPAPFPPKTAQAELQAVPPPHRFPRLPRGAVLAAERNHGAPAMIGKGDPRCPSTERPPHTTPAPSAPLLDPACGSATYSLFRVCTLPPRECLPLSSCKPPCKSQPEDSLGSALEGASLDCSQFSGTKGGFGPWRLRIEWRNRGRRRVEGASTPGVSPPRCGYRQGPHTITFIGGEMEAKTCLQDVRLQGQSSWGAAQIPAEANPLG